VLLLMPQRADGCIVERGVSTEVRDHMAACLLHVVVNRKTFTLFAFMEYIVLRPNAVRNRCRDILCFGKWLSEAQIVASRETSVIQSS
jgi:hypothetical protein